jgi:hypothetical protein
MDLSHGNLYLSIFIPLEGTNTYITGGVAQVVQHLPSKLECLSSNSSIAKINRKKKKNKALKQSPESKPQ